MKRILQIIILLAFLFVSIGFILSKKIRVVETKTINYPIAVVFNQINNLKNWANWNFWQQKDGNIEINYGDIYEGLGGEYRWGSKKNSIGTGSLWITESETNKSIKYMVDFGGKGKGEATITFDNQTNKSVKVIWVFESRVDGLLGGWFALMMKKMVKRSIKKSLENLELYLNDNMPKEDNTHLNLEEE
jgi:hypothetical protein